MGVSTTSVGLIHLSACCLEGCPGGQWGCSGAIKLDDLDASNEMRLEIRGNRLVITSGRGRKFNLCDNQSSFGSAAPGWLSPPEDIFDRNEAWYLVVIQSNSRHEEDNDVLQAFKRNPPM